MSEGITPEVLVHIGSFPISNTIINTLFVDVVLIGTAMYIKNNLTKIPGTFQNIVEFVIGTLYDVTKSIANQHAAKIFPYFASFFIFILVSNWSGLIPGLTSIGIKSTEEGHHIIPLMRNATSDLNVTFALSLVSLVATHMLSIQTIGIKEYLGRFFSLNPINLFVGILEIISEITKIISLSFRLFGNIFAGEIVLVTISSLFAFLVPIPFLFMEVIVGVVQALVFSLLTMVFMAILMTPHHEEKHEAKEVIAA